MESPPPIEIPYRIIAQGGIPEPGVNPRAITADLFRSGVSQPNYPAPSFGPAPMEMPIPVAPPLGDVMADALEALGSIPREKIAVLVPGAIALGLIAAGVAILVGGGSD